MKLMAEAGTLLKEGAFLIQRVGRVSHESYANAALKNPQTDYSWRLEAGKNLELLGKTLDQFADRLQLIYEKAKTIASSSDTGTPG